MEMNGQEYEEVFAVLVTTDPLAETLKEDPPFVIDENGKLTTVE